MESAYVILTTRRAVGVSRVREMGRAWADTLKHVAADWSSDTVWAIYVSVLAGSLMEVEIGEMIGQ